MPSRAPSDPTDTPPATPPAILVADRVPARRVIRDIAATVVPGSNIFELAVAAEVFGVDRREDGVPGYDFAVCSTTGGPVPMANRLELATPYGLERTYSADLVVVPGWPSDLGVLPSPELVAALRDAVDRGAVVASFCSGAFALAHAGLLDGRRATTHHRYAERLAEAFPGVEVDPDVLFVADADDRGTVVTSAGTAAAIDLCLHLVRESDGPGVAAAIARRMVVPPQREGGQAQYIQRPSPGPADGGAFARLLDWLVEHLEDDHTVDDLAERVAMSPRTFARRFKEQTGATPYQWVLQQRVRAAQRLLEETDQDVERIARAVGFGDAATLRLHFSRIVRTTPTAYRRTFNGTAAG